MYYSVRQYFIIFISLVLLAGCSPIKEVETETLQPAEITFPAHFSNIAFILSYPDNEFELVNKESFKDNILKELKYGIADITDNSPRFLPGNILLFNPSELNIVESTDSIGTDKLYYIADSLQVDGLIFLQKFSLDSRLKKEYNYDYGEYYLNFKITSKASWKIFSRLETEFIDSFDYSEKYVWESLSSSEINAIAKLPDYPDSFKEAAYWTGYDYANRIFPIWETNKRVYYARGNKVMRSAKEKVENNNWKEAIRLWKRNLSHPEDEMISRSAYNIALAMEMMGKIDLAMKWAKKAYEINNKQRAMQYYEDLKQRKEEMSKLENQLP
ncbi:MAG: DUF6340 family protein [Bacteroidota bacterium]